MLQRKDLRWVYIIDGKESEKTYPTAGDAQRGAWNYHVKTRPKNEGWKLAVIIAMACAPVVWLIVFVFRLLTS